MARILKRPMFSRGGSTNNGIMTGLKDRTGFAVGPEDPSIYETRVRDRSTEIQNILNSLSPVPKTKLPLGQVGVCGGYDWWQTNDGTINTNEQGLGFFVTSDDPDTRKPFISGHLPHSNQVDVTPGSIISFHLPESIRTETVSYDEINVFKSTGFWLPVTTLALSVFASFISLGPGTINIGNLFL